MRFRKRCLRFESLETRDLLATVQVVDKVPNDPAGPVTVQVEIDDASGVRAAEIRIGYDKASLDVEPNGITVGSVWQGHGAMLAR